MHKTGSNKPTYSVGAPMLRLGPWECAIYALHDPRTGDVRYVGQTKDPEARLKAHVRDALEGDPKHVYRWIRQVLVHGLEPQMRVLAVVPRSHADEAEIQWIADLRERGADLTNGTEGGQSSFAVRADRRAAYSDDELTIFGQLRRRLERPLPFPAEWEDTPENREAWREWVRDWRHQHREALKILRGKKWNFGDAVPISRRPPKKARPAGYDRDAPVDDPRALLDMFARAVPVTGPNTPTPPTH